MNGQSTDEENSKPLIKAVSAGNEPKTVSSRSVRDISGDYGTVNGASGSGNVVTAPIPGNA